MTTAKKSSPPTAPGHTQGPSIHQVLPSVMRDVGTIEKSETSATHKYRFRSIDSALNAIHPVLIAHGVSVSIRCHEHRISAQRERDRHGNPRVLSRATLMLKLSFWAPDGSRVTSTAAGEGLDVNGDKATAKAMSVAMKYALYFGLMIPVGKQCVSDPDLDGTGDTPDGK